MGKFAIITVGIAKSAGVSIQYSWDWNKVLEINVMGLIIAIMFKKVDTGGWFGFFNEYKD